MIDFNRIDVESVHSAFQEAIEDARSRAEKGMTTSAAARKEQAANLKRVRDKLLSTLTEKERESYFDYEPQMASAVALPSITVDGDSHENRDASD